MDAVAVSIDAPVRSSLSVASAGAEKDKTKSQSWRGFDDVALMTCSRLKEARIYNGYTLEQASELLGYKGNKTQLSLFETAERFPPIWVLISASKLYSVPMDYLFGFVDEIEACGYDLERAALIRHIDDALKVNNAQIRGYVTRALAQGSPTIAMARALVEKVTAWRVVFKRFSERNASFEDMPVGGKLVSATADLDGAHDKLLHALIRHDNMLTRAIELQEDRFGKTKPLFPGPHG